MTDKNGMRCNVPKPPSGGTVIKWLGPGLLWMVSSVGSGAILFTPRIGAKYTYELLWLGLLVCFFMYVLIKEAARYTLVTGKSMLEGFNDLPGPKGWAVWVVFLPQLVAAVCGVSGLSALVGSALVAGFGGSLVWWTTVVLVAATALVMSGRYGVIERVSQVLAFLLMGLATAAAFSVFPSFNKIAAGLVPGLPDQPEAGFIVPWVGTILAGSMGILWFSYWAASRGYGGGIQGMDESTAEDCGPRKEPGEEEDDPVDIGEREARLHAWMRILSGTAALGVVTGLFVLVAFLILGSELLAPENKVPQGADVMQDLSTLLSDVWGRAGFWMLIIASIIALGGSVIANQDGWGRSFADMSLILLRKRNDGRAAEPRQAGPDLNWFERLNSTLPFDLTRRRNMKRAYVLILTGILPLVVFYIFRDPVKIMSASGVVAAAHTPFIAVLIAVINRTRLSASMRPGRLTTTAVTVAALFYLVFAVLQLMTMVGALDGKG